MRIALSLVILCFAPLALGQALVAPTGPNTPEQERKMFHLPPGFEIQLVACEPDVHKPMNLTFDAHGRLWVTHSLEYPFPAKDTAKARDAITIFSDFAADGRAQKAHRFAEGLNIPIGVMPLSDTEALAWSIPNIYKLTDTNNDGVADAKSVILGPFDFRDTHGDQNSFTRWVDGWVYANHGYSNDSKPKLKGEGDKPALMMQSGHTYRFRPDGSAAEVFSFGQVNPFGLSFDALGNLFSADCHSRAVTMLLHEGYYPSFGKPHDGLGFAPETTNTDHGGTGIAGVVYYAADAFPKKFQDVLFIGNVITTRIHVDRLKWTGSSPWVESVDDFLTCDDPWFRPVCITLGPDGALYVADFYNKIIGHYEVPLTHPERDRERGRIWRIVYTGEGAKKQPVPDLAKAPLDEVAAQLASTNLIVRTLATNAMIDRFPKKAAARAQTVFKSAFIGGQSRDDAFANAIWVIARTAGVAELPFERLASEKSPVVRVHLAKALGEASGLNDTLSVRLRGLAGDVDPFVRRAAAEAMAKHPAAENVAPLLKLIRETDKGDTQLVQAARIALRDQLRDDAVATAVSKMKFEGADESTLLEIAAVTPGDAAAAMMFDAAVAGKLSNESLTRVLPAAARKVEPNRADAMVDLVTSRFGGQNGFQIEVLRNLFEGVAGRGASPTPKMTATLTSLLRPAVAGDPASAWRNLPVPGAAPSENPWGLERRQHADGKDDELAASSLRDHNEDGEKRTGILRSPTFTLPAKLSFWVCGHNGMPGTPDLKKNYVRVVLTDGTEVARVYPPRNDAAEKRSFDLSKVEGKQGYVEVVDCISNLSGYGWIAVSRFDPPVIRIPQRGQLGNPDAARASAIRLAGSTRLAELTDDVVKAATAEGAGAEVRVAGAEALLTLRPPAAAGPLIAVLSDGNVPIPQRQQAAQLLGRVEGSDARTALLTNLRAAPQPVAVAIATSIAGSKEGAEALLADIRAGKASPALLKEPTVADRLHDSGVADLDKQISELTAKLSPADDRVGKLIADRRAHYLALSPAPDPASGKAVFAKSVCAQCHKLADVGGPIGPALDGIGNRGLDRLLEDVLDPNRNVDQAFRVTIVRTKKGQTYAGFNVREEGATLVMNDSGTGKEVRVPVADIDRKQISTLSPMPANIDEVMTEADFQQLMAYLLSSRVK